MTTPPWAALIRDVADFPRPGVTFKDITPLLADGVAFAEVVDRMAEPYLGQGISKVVGIEARGFVLAAPVAHRIGAGFVPVRKPGKLPWETASEAYELEYGTDELHVHLDSVAIGEKVLIVDDVLATGGTARAALRLVEGLEAEVAGLAFLVELAFLGGADRLGGVPHVSLLRYD